MDVISCHQFKKRLVELCIQSALSGFPRKRRDQHILLKSMTLTLDAEAEYAEQEVNERLKSWLSRCRSFNIDHVSLRRRLVEEGYLVRSADGSCYRVSVPPQAQLIFDPSLDGIDVLETLQAGVDSIERKKKAWQERG